MNPPVRNEKGQWVVNTICSQCGAPWASEACGPTHAVIAAEIKAGVTVTRQEV